MLQLLRRDVAELLISSTELSLLEQENMKRMLQLKKERDDWLKEQQKKVMLIVSVPLFVFHFEYRMFATLLFIAGFLSS